MCHFPAIVLFYADQFENNDECGTSLPPEEEGRDINVLLSGLSEYTTDLGESIFATLDLRQH